MKKYDTVIFDLDGTILYTLEDLNNSMNYALKVNGFGTITLDDSRRFVGNGIVKYVERALALQSRYDSARVEGLDNPDVKLVYDSFISNYIVHCNDKTCAYPGIIELMRTLCEKGYRLGIATNKDKVAAVKLNELYFEGMITGVAGVLDGCPKKPDPYMINEVLKELGSDREHTIYVGDSEVDVMTAKNSGLDMVAVLWGYRDRDELEKAGATVFIDDAMQLIEVLENE